MKLQRVVLTAAVAAGLPSCSASASPLAADVLLITVDTLRADALEAYGCAECSTPAMASLARSGTVFVHAYTPVPMTVPAHASLMTSVYPETHGVIDNVGPLGPAGTTLAETLSAHGYVTAAFAGVYTLGERSGLGRGFSVHSAPQSSQRRAQLVVEEAAAWLRKASGDRPVMVWVHLFDPHQPYELVPGFGSAGRQALDPAMLTLLPKVDWKSLDGLAAAGTGNLDARVLRHARQLYQAEVSYVDHWVGVMLERLRETRGGRPSVVVLTADHGECFEHGVYFEHSDCLYQGAVRVPLLVRGAPNALAGQRISTPVSLLDVAPSVLAWVGAPRPESFAGGLLPLGHAPQPAAPVVLFTQPRMVPDEVPFRVRAIRSVAGEPVRPPDLIAQRTGLVRGGWKIIRGTGAPEIYDVSDPARDQDVSAARSRTVLPELQAALQKAAGSWRPPPPAGRSAEASSAEDVAALNELGYVH